MTHTEIIDALKDALGDVEHPKRELLVRIIAAARDVYVDCCLCPDENYRFRIRERDHTIHMDWQFFPSELPVVLAYWKTNNLFDSILLTEYNRAYRYLHRVHLQFGLEKRLMPGNIK